MKIDPFPGTLERSSSWGTPYVPTEEQAAWLCKWYPVCNNDVIAKMMGIGCSTVIRFAKRMGIVKDKGALSRRYSEIQKKIIESERRRDRWGLPRRTTYHLPHNNLTKREIIRRWKAKKKLGYIVVDARTEEWNKRKVIYYDGNTSRSKKFEKYCRKAGFHIKEWDERND